MHWSGRWGRRGAICLVGLLALAIPSLALAQRGDRGERGGERASKPPPGGGLERAREAEQRRLARRDAPSARAERRSSRGRYRARGREGALEVARQELPELVEKPAWEPLKLRRGQRVARYFGEFGAQVVGGDRGPVAVDSTLPLRSEVGGGPKRLVDLALEQRGGALVARNPLVSTRIPERPMDGIELGDDGFAVGLESPSSSQAQLVKGRAFVANALTDTDLVVLPTPRGAQISLQVRSADAPERATLPVRLPAGAALRMVRERRPGGRGRPEREDPRAGEGPPEGSAEVVRGEEVLARIQPPAAWGADGEPLEGVGYEVDGSELVVSFPHRSADVLYPLAVDPQVDRFRVNETGQPIGNGSYVIGNGSEAAAWNYNRFGYGSENFGAYPGIAGYTYEHNNILALSSAGYRGYANNSLGQWYWQAPRQSWIFRADYVNVDFIPTYQPHPLAMCVLEGVASVTRGGAWEPGAIYEPTNQSGGSRYFGQSPWAGGPAPGGSCSPQADNSKSHLLTSPTPGNIAAYRLFAYGDGARTNGSFTQMDGAAIHLDDAQAPSITSASSAPGGWVRSATITTTVSARDAAPGTPVGRGGLGMFVSVLSPPTEGGGAQINRFAACQIRLSRCPEAQTFSYSYSTEADLNPDAAGVQRVREGASAVTGIAYDATGKTRSFTAGTLRVDRSGPSATLGGIQSGQLLRDRDYAIAATATDALSGARKVQIKLDGAVVAQRTDCPSTGAPCGLDWTLDGGDPALTEGTHTIEVAAKDQVDNDAPVVKRTFRVERTAPAVDLLEGSLKPPGSPWVGSGERGVSFDASDEGGAGVTHARLEVDGETVRSRDLACEQGGCPLTSDFLIDTATLSEGEHEVSAVARDGAGNAVRRDWTIKLERSAPGLTLDGPPARSLAPGESSQVSASATDASGPAMQSGLGSLSFAVDDDGAEVASRECADGGCPLSEVFEYVADEHGTGPHTVTVTATDLAGNETQRSLTIDNAEPPADKCEPGPAPASAPDLLPVTPDVARAGFRVGFPRALEPPSLFVLDGEALLARLDGVLGLLFRSTGTLAPLELDRRAGDGVTATLETAQAPMCITPTEVGAGASDPVAIGDAAALYANSAPATDTLLRPTAVGVEALSQLRGPLGAKELSWHVAMEQGQQLRELSDGSVAVVEPAEPGAEPPATDETVAGPPTLARRQDAVVDSELQLRHASDELERAQATTADGIVAVVPKPWAKDALDRPVETSLSAEGSTVTMRLAPAPTAVYPVIADRQLFTADAVDTAEALGAAETTEPSTDAQTQAYEPPVAPEQPTPRSALAAGDPAPGDDPLAGDDPFDGHDLSDIDGSGSGGDDEDEDILIEDDDAGGDGSITPPDDDPSTPLTETARRQILNVDLGLTDSDPGALTNPAYAGPDGVRGGGWRFLRPFVTYRVGLIEKKKERGDALSTDEANRLRIWESWYDRASAAGYTADVALTPSSGGRAPSVRGYRHAVDVFLNRYGSVVDHLFAWNEPNYKGSPLRRKPKRAALLWFAARRECHGPGAMRCRGVIAGDFAGKPAEGAPFKPPNRRRRVGYTAAYHDWLERVAKGRDQRRPAVWSFHAYGDMKAWALKRGRVRYSAPIFRRYARIFSRYRRGGKSPRVWLAEVGAPYHYSCRAVPRRRAKRASKSLREKYCKTNDKQTRRVLVLGQRLQRFAAAFLLKKVAQYPAINRIYYYNLMSRPPLRCKGSEDPDEPRELRCRRNEWGLLGADDDPAYLRRIADPPPDPERIVYAKGRGPDDYSTRGQIRTAHPLLRDREPCRLSNPRRIKLCR